MPGSGDFVSFFRPGGLSFALKSCPGAGIFAEKIISPWVSPGGGGVVTGEIDTCISSQISEDWLLTNKNKMKIAFDNGFYSE